MSQIANSTQAPTEPQPAQTLEQTISEVVRAQQQFVRSGATRPVEFRLRQLERLKTAIKRYETRILEALQRDLRKPEFEGYSTEVGYAYDSIRYVMKHLRRWVKPERVRTPLAHIGSSSYIYREPYGSTLIIGPFNYPCMLVIDPLIGAISAGNAAIVKPSEYTPHVSRVIAEMLGEYFEPDYIRVIEGGPEATSALIHAPLDFIFFTGSIRVGKIVMAAAAEHLVPVILELGGKSPCIVDQEADLDLAAQRIVWGKFLNTGQTCVAPDYVLVHESVRAELVAKMKAQIKAFYGEDPRQSPDYGRIVNEQQWSRLMGLLEPSKVVVGGDGDREDLYLGPTILDNVSWEDSVMQEEIFGPILPVLDYRDLDVALREIGERPKPLALYLFTSNAATERKVMESVSFGGGCVNDTVMHLVSPYLPFGGVGSSGMGAYHGRYSYETFSHRKSVLKKSTRVNLSFIYPPYTAGKLKLIRRFFK
ncbi:aldehyde dehydrogenase [Paenibacillus sp. p3-SID1389]|uniref:aldehyde dehydrogenase n=1 Tax=Paenibacillus sp. p3-SID1389 TaxID=2916364 RepID=UPI0021A327F9|nr:aldehyde dehydrogenase [Paenibacillus sp. p3-SID1389]MCT2196891.1 aldehyde dehydrogenase [Paenibacillus sp. p3-SID1389]